MRPGWTLHHGEWFFGGREEWLARAWPLNEAVGGGWRWEWMRGYGDPCATLAEAQEAAEARIRAYRDRLSYALEVCEQPAEVAGGKAGR